MAPTEKDNISLTPKQIGVILAVVLAIASGFPIGVNKLTPQRYDPFTGDDGDKLEAKIRRECESNLSFLQFQIDDIKEADAALEDKYNEHSHRAPLLWVEKKLKFLQDEINNVNQRVSDHDTYAEKWKHRIVAIEERQKKQ